MAHAKGKSNRIILLIGGFAILKAALLIIVAMAVHRLIVNNVADTVHAWVHHVRIDPENNHIHTAIEKLTGIPKSRLKELSIGTLIYATLFFVEGVGLLLRKTWAEYLTVITTSGLLPLEIYEVFERASWLRVLLLIVNLAIVAYLIRQIQIGRKLEKSGFEVVAPAPSAPEASA
jgi:uncharacterized membrane protein (DUF2068 family)